MRIPFTSRRPSPALVLAFVALLAALSGTAVALPGKNTVSSDDLKKGSVKNSDIARGAVTGSKLRNGAVTGAKIENNAVTGAKVNESTLAQVPSAANAGTAATVAGLAPSGIARVAFASDDATALAGVSGTVLTTTIAAPGAGFLLIDAGSDVFGPGPDFVTCSIQVDETQSPASERDIELGVDNTEENCSTETAVQVSAGNHKVDFEAAGLEATTTFDEATLQVLFVPFGATGTQP